MRVLAVVASDSRPDDDRPALPRGDCAALAWGVELAGRACRAYAPAGDDAASGYARAVGAACRPWDALGEAPFDAALIGPGATARYGDELPGRLAESAGAELIFDVIRVRRERGAWIVACDAGRGAQDVITVEGPVVLVASPQAPRPPYVSRYRLSMAAARLQADASAVGLARELPAWQQVTPRVPRAKNKPSPIGADARADAAFGIAGTPQSDRDRAIVADDPATCARVLLRYLVHHGFVSRRLPVGDDAPVSVAASNRSSPAAPAHLTASPGVAVRLPATRGARAAARRGPRGAGETPERLARRPRVAERGDRLRRGPRLLGAPRRAGSRGPFPIPSAPAVAATAGRLGDPQHSDRIRPR